MHSFSFAYARDNFSLETKWDIIHLSQVWRLEKSLLTDVGSLTDLGVYFLLLFPCQICNGLDRNELHSSRGIVWNKSEDIHCGYAMVW